MESDQLVWGYVTAKDLTEAESIANELVKTGLAACVNLLPGMKSIYRWQGKVERAEEVVIVVKTRTELRASVTERIKKMHSYDCPCVIFLPIEGGNPDYLKWLVDNSSVK